LFDGSVVGCIYGEKGVKGYIREDECIEKGGIIDREHYYNNTNISVI
jgi:hypothetical protein